MSIIVPKLDLKRNCRLQSHAIKQRKAEGLQLRTISKKLIQTFNPLFFCFQLSLKNNHAQFKITGSCDYVQFSMSRPMESAFKVRVLKMAIMIPFLLNFTDLDFFWTNLKILSDDVSHPLSIQPIPLIVYPISLKRSKNQLNTRYLNSPGIRVLDYRKQRTLFKTLIF